MAAQDLEAATGWTALDTMRRLGMTRYPVFSILDRVWELRDNLSAYDASYVARSPWCPANPSGIHACWDITAASITWRSEGSMANGPPATGTCQTWVMYGVRPP